MEYWTIIDDRHAGPYTVDELIEMGLKPESPVWTSGLPDWVEASEIEELRVAIESRAVSQASAPEASSPAPAPEPEPSAEFPPAPAPETGGPVEPMYAQAPFQPVPEPVQPAPGHNPAPMWDWQREATVPDEPCPPAYLAWSIIVTILCCQVLGIAAIICSAQTKQAYNRGNLAKAKKMSDWAQWLIIISIVLGLVSLPLQLVLMSF